MSVVGIGTDIVDVRRIANMKTEVRNKLAKRVLITGEYEKYLQFKQPEKYLAKRWAGKEAAAKALGKGIADGISFQHIEILSLSSGQPTLILTERALEVAQQLQANSWHISLSDEENYATAFVVLSK